jgi:hypothetical protein
MQEPSAPPIEQISYTISPVSIPESIYSINSNSYKNPVYDLTAPYSSQEQVETKNNCLSSCVSFIRGKKN